MTEQGTMIICVSRLKDYVGQGCWLVTSGCEAMWKCVRCLQGTTIVLSPLNTEMG